MNCEVSLSEYYHKLVHVQFSAHITEALKEEMQHHLSNGASNLQALMRIQGIKDPVRDAHLVAETNRIKDGFTEKLTEMMKPIENEKLAIRTIALPLAWLVNDPEIRTLDNFTAMAALNDHLITLNDKIKDMRADAEAEILRSSGFVTNDFNLASLPDFARDFYKKLVEVQLSVKIAHVLFSKVTSNFGMAPETLKLLKSVTDGTLRLNLNGTRLISIVSNPAMLTRENFNALSAFNDRLRGINHEFREVHTRAEIQQLKDKGALPEDFKL